MSSSDASATGDPSGSGSEGESTSSDPGRGDPSSGDPIDDPPTIALAINGSPAPAAILKASTPTISAVLDDDRGLDRLEIFVDEASEPLAEVLLAGSLHEVVEVGLPIHESLMNGTHSVRAVVHDDGAQASSSLVIDLEVALPPGGSTAWEVLGESKFVSKALAVTVDSIGDVIAVGESAVSIDPHRSRMTIRKYRGEDGALLWSREVPSQSEAPVPAGNNIARAVAVDSADNVVVAGEVRPDGLLPSLWLGKFTHDGLLAGSYVSDEPRSRGNGVAVDGMGQIFVVGYRTNAELSSVATVEAFGQSLKPLWSDTFADIGVETQAYGLAIDHNGDVVIVGSVQASEDKKQSLGLFALYNPGGARQWWRLASTAQLESRERIFSVAVSDDNEYLCAGRRRIDGDPRRLWFLRFGDGGEEITSEIDIFAGCGDLMFEDDNDVCGVALDDAGRSLFAAVFPGSSDDFMVKRTKSDWSITLWLKTHDGLDHATDRGLAVTSDADGLVIAAGYETSLGIPRWWLTKRNP